MRGIGPKSSVSLGLPLLYLALVGPERFRRTDAPDGEDE
jgi:hypothetical protein